MTFFEGVWELCDGAFASCAGVSAKPQITITNEGPLTPDDIQRIKVVFPGNPARTGFGYTCTHDADPTGEADVDRYSIYFFEPQLDGSIRHYFGRVIDDIPNPPSGRRESTMRGKFITMGPTAVSGSIAATGAAIDDWTSNRPPTD